MIIPLGQSAQRDIDGERACNRSCTESIKKFTIAIGSNLCKWLYVQKIRLQTITLLQFSSLITNSFTTYDWHRPRKSGHAILCRKDSYLSVCQEVLQRVHVHD